MMAIEGLVHPTTMTIVDSVDSELGKDDYNAAHKQRLADSSLVSPPLFSVDASNYTTGLTDHTSGLVILSRPVDVRMLGAKCDGRYVADATITSRVGAGNVTITSATIAFTSSDVGKYWGLNPTGTSAAYAVYTGYIVSVESATSATCHSFNTTSAVASGAGLMVATDDSVAIGRAITRLTGYGGTIKIPGISASSAVLSLPEGVNLEGDGKGAGNPLGFVSRGSVLNMLGAYAGVDSKFLAMAGKGSCISDITIDACNKCDRVVETAITVATRWRIMAANLARGAEFAFVGQSGTGLMKGCEIYNGFRGVAVSAGGDTIIENNYIYGSGDTKANVRANSPTDDFLLLGNHIYKGGWGVTLSTVTGPNVLFEAASLTEEVGGVIANNTFDTCEGHHIEVIIYSSADNKDIKSLIISNNQFYQPLAFTTDTYSCIKLTSGTSGTNHVSIRALSITGNVGKGNTANSRAYKSFIDVSLLATYGHIYGSSVQGNTIDNCNLGYTGSWAEAGTPGSTAPDVGANMNIRIAGVTDTATAF